MKTKRIEALADDLRQDVFETIDNELEYNGDDAGKIAHSVEVAFLSAVAGLHNEPSNYGAQVKQLQMFIDSANGSLLGDILRDARTNILAAIHSDYGFLTYSDFNSQTTERQQQIDDLKNEAEALQSKVNELRATANEAQRETKRITAARDELRLALRSV